MRASVDNEAQDRFYRFFNLQNLAALDYSHWLSLALLVINFLYFKN